MDSRKGIALYGGTFDPVHFGHLRSALEVHQILGVSETRLVPANIPPHRDSLSTTAEQRLAMLYLAVEDSEFLKVDDREIRRQGKSFTVDTLKSVRQEMTQDAPLSFIIGADACVLLHEWHAWESMTEYAHLVILERPGYLAHEPAGDVADWLKGKLVDDPQCLSQQSAGLVCRMRLTQLDVSATKIRDLVQRGDSIEYLLPRDVNRYIDKHQLYRKVQT
ncbi:MAG: nicotinate-nucleotide adenylyltransferase [Pseudomonadales bacterium]|jgi:nicotinate-nucleotide adenylyltransferase|nr:nicotinate-nucleotide adenylyltransferase [Pseudomonadales bacterium]MDP6317326.1 nicotinate-nucleotide adenylyltransferase [Pseudomonadales bacterium]MDP7314453.1 nicotinate-nucleotide adenylyltransferase [Pseudomonadales bacterium]|tara:strand:+ start:6382 stop:7041 length:660 start_codon:yes stop_codon:yes gene_type:complete